MLMRRFLNWWRGKSVKGTGKELQHHIDGAITNGCTKEEIREVLLHVSVYAGMPAGLNAARVAKEFFDKTEEKS